MVISSRVSSCVSRAVSAPYHGFLVSSCFKLEIVSWKSSLKQLYTYSEKTILLTKTTAARNGVALSYHSVRGLYYLAVAFAATIGT